jgi:hypothetical protein
MTNTFNYGTAASFNILFISTTFIILSLDSTQISNVHGPFFTLLHSTHPHILQGLASRKKIQAQTRGSSAVHHVKAHTSEVKFRPISKA